MGLLGEGYNKKSDLWITSLAPSLGFFHAGAFFPLPILEILVDELISGTLFSAKIWIFYFRFANG